MQLIKTINGNEVPARKGMICNMHFFGGELFKEKSPCAISMVSDMDGGCICVDGNPSDFSRDWYAPCHFVATGFVCGCGDEHKVGSLHWESFLDNGVCFDCFQMRFNRGN